MEVLCQRSFVGCRRQLVVRSSFEQVADLKVHTLLCACVDDYAYQRCLLQLESAIYASADPKLPTAEEAYARSSVPGSSVFTEMPQQC
jgi:hypothetical protein